MPYQQTIWYALWRDNSDLCNFYSFYNFVNILSILHSFVIVTVILIGDVVVHHCETYTCKLNGLDRVQKG